MASATQLSGNDSAVLGALFDPEASLSSAYRTGKSDDSAYDDHTLQHIRESEREALLLINTANPSSAHLQSSIAELDTLIKRYPEYASAYNNRAQARRMTYNGDELLEHHDAINSILADLALAIRLASPSNDTDAVSSGTAEVLAAAYTHRAFMLYKASKLDKPSTTLAGVKGMAGLDGEQLEEIASRDFAAGGRYGNKVAKQLAVKTNPYAKLCGNIVKEAMRREFEIYSGM
ncbi:hypothetical protein LTR36_003000 [Oleoguttula mirabilis]|uniref:Uncharacterized protein n=1 Tax=Oleoguttula mirabilis TaxID=1507867 RepID=A0AAV9JWN8_9PEZI|nr:hypothetical protein LTR36_003000 [Oleoguttula mirabilis]